MDEFKGTPGPWQAHGPVVTANGLRISQTHFGYNADADARLIAAAPELLAACLETLDAVNGSHAQVMVAVGKMKAAVTKALHSV